MANWFWDNIGRPIKEGTQDLVDLISGDVSGEELATNIQEMGGVNTSGIGAAAEQAQTDLEGYQDQLSQVPTVIRGNDGNFYYSTDLDESGNPVQGATPVANFTDIRQQAQDLGGDFMSFQDWINQTGANYLDPQDAITQYEQAVEDYRNRDRGQEQQDAINFAARLLGLVDENGNGSLEDEYQAYQGQLLNTAQNGGQGYTDAQRDIMQRAIQRNASNMQANAQQLINKIAAQTGGSTSRAMAAADAQLNEISDYVIQANAQMALDELDYQMSQMQSAIQMQSSLTSAMSANANAFLESIDREYFGLFEAYAQNINNILAANGMTLNEYNADMQSVANATQAAYEGIMVQLGVEQTAIDSAWQGINAQMNQILAGAGLTMDQWQLVVDQLGIDIALQELQDSQVGLFDIFTDLALPIGLALL